MLVLLGERDAWTPLRIRGLQVWLDAGRIPGLGDGAAVATWPDVSGNGRNGSEADPLKQPVYRAAAVNGRPAVEFNGTQRVMLANAGGCARAVGGFTLFLVLKSLVVGVQQFIAFWSTGLSAGAARVSLTREWTLPGDVEMRARRLDEDVAVAVGGGVVAAGAWGVDCGVVDWANARGWVFQNGAQVGAADPYLTPGVTQDTASLGVEVGAISGGSGFQGQLAEVLAYNWALPAELRSRVERYLARKYGLGWG